MKMALWIARASHLLQWEDARGKHPCLNSSPSELTTTFSEQLQNRATCLWLISLIPRPHPLMKRNVSLSHWEVCAGTGILTHVLTILNVMNNSGIQIMWPNGVFKSLVWELWHLIWREKYDIKFPTWNMCSASQNPAGLPTKGYTVKRFRLL